MGLHRKFDGNMKGNSKLLINEATFGFANNPVFIEKVQCSKTNKQTQRQRQ